MRESDMRSCRKVDSFAAGARPSDFDHRVMHGGPHGRNLVVFARGIDAIGQQDDEKLAVRINPDRRAGKSQMPETARRKIAAARGIGRRHHPAERARVARERLGSGELRNRRASQQAMVAVYPAIQKHLAERREIGRRREHSGVPGDAAHGERVFVVHLALHEALSKRRVIFRGRDAAAADSSAD